jgi:hypothetical protein
MFFAQAILASLVLLGCLTNARYLVPRDSVIDRYVFLKLSEKKLNSL